jgi:hypothetical protein
VLFREENFWKFQWVEEIKEINEGIEKEKIAVNPVVDCQDFSEEFINLCGAVGRDIPLNDCLNVDAKLFGY